jgi:carbon monoxide dehydrogenase subunit G
MGTPPTVIDYRRSFLFEATPEGLWQALSEPHRFEGWWGWLGELRVEGAGLVDGAVLSGLVSPPVPYRMRVDVHLDRCQPPRRIDATVEGDLRGTAWLELRPHEAGTKAEVAWRIEMMQRAMRVAARVASPLLHWGHDRVVDMTVAGFRRHLSGLPGAVSPAQGPGDPGGETPPEG